MMAIKNYTSQLLRVNLTDHKIQKEEISRSLILEFLGGRGLGAKILFDELKPSTEPLSPENKVLILAGPLVGTQAPWCVKYAAVTRSPLSGTILMSLAGGFFGANLRFAGCDGLVIEGRAEKHSYLWVHEGKAELRGASHLWGKHTDDCQETLQRELGEKAIQTACIGPAGERKVRFSCVISGNRAAGRGGAGAVLGSKNLKAIAVKGGRKVPVLEAQRFQELQTAIRKKAAQAERLKVFGKYGTPKNLVIVNDRGLFPTRNFQGGVFYGVDQVNATEQQKRVLRKTTCHACPVACGNMTRAAEGPYEGVLTEGPEYETFWAFGAQCGNTDIDAIIAADRLCDQLGMDTISTGSAIAFAMECAERGVISQEDLEGLDLRFGNRQAMVAMIHRIGNRQGLGDLLAEGVRRAAERLGRGSENFAMHVKGLELAAYDPRGAKGMGIAYATSPRGGCHERGLISRETFGAPPYIDPLSLTGKGLAAREAQDETAVLDSLGVCVFPPHNDGMDMDDTANLVSCVVGESVSAGDLMTVGERVWNLERLFNLREGFTKKDDTLPPRLLQEPMPQGPARGHVVELAPLLEDYYKIRGWDDNGVPTPSKLRELGLTEEGEGVRAGKKRN